jgi:hypothetical protein
MSRAKCLFQFQAGTRQSNSHELPLIRFGIQRTGELRTDYSAFSRRLGCEMGHNSRFVHLLSRLLFVSLVLLPIAAGQVNQENSTAFTASLSLQLRLGGGRTQFHVGEIIPVEMVFTSGEHKKYSINPFDCFARQTYQYHVDPPLFLDRAGELDAALEMEGLTCSGGVVDINPGEKPFTVEQILNSRFRMDTPGKYRISVTSTRLGLSVTSNAVEMEIAPADPAWQKSELDRALGLIKLRTEKDLVEGCRVLRYLRTDAAAVTIAKEYGDLTPCASFANLDAAVISAPNRMAVLEELQAGIAAPDRPISTGYLRTIAIVSLYQEHPDWYPQQQPATESEEVKLLAGPTENSGLWRERGALPNREIFFAKQLAAALPKKGPEARAKSLETLLYLGRTLGYIEIPREIMNAAQGEIAANFRSLPPGDQNYVLRHLWPEIKSPAMIPVLREVVETGFVPASNWPQSVALRRLYELSPEEARPYILGELRSEYPRIDISVLGLLPEKDLPELDQLLLSRVEKSQDNGYRVAATALVQRYASPAIEKDLRPFMAQNIGKTECESEANLLAYFLRVAPNDGDEMLQEAMHAQGRLSCRDTLLQRLATIRMSPEVEQAAIAALNDSDSSVVLEALNVLKDYGSADCKSAILRAFSQWHKQWEARAKDLDMPENARWQIDGAYFSAAALAQAWLSSEQDFEALRDLCLTQSCKQAANSTLVERSQKYVMIAVVEPVGDEIVERFMPGGTMERLEQKMAEYPRDTLFQIDARFKEYDAVQRFFNELRPWTSDHGYLLQIYLD